MSVDPGMFAYEEPPHAHEHETLESKYLCEIEHNVALPIPLVLLDGLTRLATAGLSGEQLDCDAELRATYTDMVGYLENMLKPALERAELFAKAKANERRRQISQREN